ncbi:hypothetical protein LJR168_003281 [Pseudoxanthomonas sp. LjRoot168]|uniref:hypothetical protein n=1 Tax=unclassified Pseudoxanthomonas TaxID=2645906 RepID=UPI003ECC2F49
MKRSRARAMCLFDLYSDMADDEQARALALLKRSDAALHDALVQLLVADALAHDLDAPPWLRQADVQEALRDLQVPVTAPDRLHR